MPAFRGTLRFANGSIVQEVTGLLRRITADPNSCFDGSLEVGHKTLARLLLAEEEFELDVMGGPLLRITIESGVAGSESLGSVDFLSSVKPLRDSVAF
jgi:hypothetical protein